MLNNILIIALIALALIDVLSTDGILKRGGSELHPVVRVLMATFGKGWGLVKLAVTAWAAIIWADQRGLLVIAVAVMAAVVARNLWILRAMMRRQK